tara:strand:+ start:425 stop:577 length:153 start_codon:yes stop_codon:yes gene_type:complete
VISPTYLPALALMTDFPSGHDMLPLDTLTAFGLFSSDISALGSINIAGDE